MATDTVMKTCNELVNKLEAQLNKMVNEEFHSPAWKQKESVPLTLERVRFKAMQTLPFVMNRRDCWAIVQSKAPLDVKQAVWKHEEDELIMDERVGSNHPAAQLDEARRLGVPEEDLKDIRPIPEVKAALYAWLHLANSRSWLAILAASHILERHNNSDLVKGGGGSARWRERVMKELGIEQHKLTSTNVHVEADIEHTDLIWEAIARHVCDERSYNEVMEGARESLDIMAAYHSAVALGMSRLP